ncbi:MAG: UTP--glucose-1-phosphate uridylyltransferase GalU [Psittacicella sp.]
MKAIIPVAGLGTRMLPATKSIPKEMLTVVDKPVIQYIMDECVQAGVTEFIFITHALKNAIENYFDTSYELESILASKSKFKLLNEINSIVPQNIKISHTRQGSASGLGHAVLCAKQLLNDSPFVVVLPDVIMANYSSDLEKDNLASMIKNFKKTGKSQIMVNQVPKDKISAYGVVSPNNKEEVSEEFFAINNIVEKPKKEDAPSNLAVTGRYLFTSEIWKYLEETVADASGEIQLTDAIKAFLKDGNNVNAYNIKGKHFDCGNKVGYMEAIIEYGKRHPEIGQDVEELLK